jgi:hypothetical protein
VTLSFGVVSQLSAHARKDADLTFNAGFRIFFPLPEWHSVINLKVVLG